MRPRPVHGLSWVLAVVLTCCCMATAAADPRAPRPPGGGGIISDEPVIEDNPDLRRWRSRTTAWPRFQLVRSGVTRARVLVGIVATGRDSRARRPVRSPFVVGTPGAPRLVRSRTGPGGRVWVRLPHLDRGLRAVRIRTVGTKRLRRSATTVWVWSAGPLS